MKTKIYKKEIKIKDGEIVKCDDERKFFNTTFKIAGKAMKARCLIDKGSNITV
jgi:hypothetical protein